MNKCAQSVYKSEGGWGHSYQCKRAAGFGPDAKYCSQHAEKYTEGNTVEWYRATMWTEWSCEITVVNVLKETDSTLLIKSAVRTSRENKVGVNHRYFKTKSEVIDFYRARIAGLRARVEKVESLLEKYESELSFDQQP